MSSAHSNNYDYYVHKHQGQARYLWVVNESSIFFATRWHLTRCHILQTFDDRLKQNSDIMHPHTPVTTGKGNHDFTGNPNTC